MRIFSRYIHGSKNSLRSESSLRNFIFIHVFLSVFESKVVYLHDFNF